MAEIAENDAAWQLKANAWKWDKPAQAATVCAIFSSLGALFDACLFLNGHDLRFNPLFWLMALPLMCWYGPLQSMKRWAIVSLPASLVLWPSLAAAVCLFGHWQRAHGVFHRLATPVALGSGFTVSLLLALAGFIALRRSSLPGGSRMVSPKAANYRPADALPSPDAALLTLKWPFLACLLSWIVTGVVSSVAMAGVDLDFDHVLRRTFWPMLAAIPVVVGCFALGASQSLRKPGKPSPAYLAMLLVEALYCAGLTVELLAAFHAAHPPLAGAAMLTIAGGCFNLCADFYAWTRIRTRSALLRSPAA